MFLSSKQAFPLRLRYDRLTGWLQELDGFLLESVSQQEVGPNSPSYGATEAEREKCLNWLASERFLPFQRLSTEMCLDFLAFCVIICAVHCLSIECCQDADTVFSVLDFSTLEKLSSVSAAATAMNS